MPSIITPPAQQRAAGPGLSFWLGTKTINQPLAMQADLAARLRQAIADNAFDPSIDIGASRFAGTYDARSLYRVTDDGIALVPVSGMLLDRGGWLGDLGGWATTYEGLAEQFQRLAKDDAIKSVVLDIDSGGGMAAGLFDLAVEMGKLRKTKKVYALAANFAASAAYAIACGADEVYVTRGGMAGSVGTIIVHTSYQRALDQAGMDTTIIYEGDHKPDGNAFQQLSHGARSEMAAMVAQLNGQFIAHVAARRGMDEADVRALKARVFIGDKAVEAGLADGVLSTEELLDKIRNGSKSARGKPNGKGGRTVSDGNSPGAAQRSDLEDVISAAIAGFKAASSAAQPAPVAAPAAPVQQQPVQPAAVAPAAEARERIRKILSCEAAKKRPQLAQYLALEKDLDAETSIEVLGAAPEETAAPAAGLDSALHQQMARAGNAAGVKPEAGGGSDTRPSLAARVAAKFPANSKKRA